MTAFSSAISPLATSSAATASRFNEMSSEDFLKIMFTELQNQDPFQPNDSAALLEQLNSIRSIESDIALTKRLDALVFENQLAGAGNLLGKFVSGLTQDNDRVAGFAVAIVRENNTVLLELDNGYRVPISSIEEVIDVDAFGPPTASVVPAAPGTPSESSPA
jgi:flagellar basal-body rod modification protein FlgD